MGLLKGEKAHKLDILITEWLYANPNDCDRLAHEIANIVDNIPSLVQRRKKHFGFGLIKDFFGLGLIIEKKYGNEERKGANKAMIKKYGNDNQIWQAYE